MADIGRVLEQGPIFIEPTGGIAATLFQKLHPNTIPGQIARLATDALKGVAMFFYVIACILTVVLLFVIDYAINNRFVSMVNRVAVDDLRGVASGVFDVVRSLASDVRGDFKSPTADSDSDDASSISSVSDENGDDDVFDAYTANRNANFAQQFGAMDARSFADFKNSAARDSAAFQGHATNLQTAFDADVVPQSAGFDARDARVVRARADFANLASRVNREFADAIGNSSNAGSAAQNFELAAMLKKVSDRAGAFVDSSLLRFANES